jgi:hypothetical protein
MSQEMASDRSTVDATLRLPFPSALSVFAKDYMREPTFPCRLFIHLAGLSPEVGCFFPGVGGTEPTSFCP